MPKTDDMIKIGDTTAIVAMIAVTTTTAAMTIAVTIVETTGDMMMTGDTMVKIATTLATQTAMALSIGATSWKRNWTLGDKCSHTLR